MYSSVPVPAIFRGHGCSDPNQAAPIKTARRQTRRIGMIKVVVPDDCRMV